MVPTGCCNRQKDDAHSARSIGILWCLQCGANNLGSVVGMRTIVVLALIALALIVTSGWLTPATPFNGLSILAFALLWGATILFITKTKEN